MFLAFILPTYRIRPFFYSNIVCRQISLCFLLVCVCVSFPSLLSVQRNFLYFCPSHSLTLYHIRSLESCSLLFVIYSFIFIFLYILFCRGIHYITLFIYNHRTHAFVSLSLFSPFCRTRPPQNDCFVTK